MLPRPRQPAGGLAAGTGRQNGRSNEGTHKSSYNIGKRKFLQNASSSTALQEKTAWGFKIPDEVPGPCGISGIYNPIYNKCARCVGVKWQLTQSPGDGSLRASVCL